MLIINFMMTFKRTAPHCPPQEHMPGYIGVYKINEWDETVYRINPICRFDQSDCLFYLIDCGKIFRFTYIEFRHIFSICYSFQVKPDCSKTDAEGAFCRLAMIISYWAWHSHLFSIGFCFVQLTHGKDLHDVFSINLI